MDSAAALSKENCRRDNPVTHGPAMLFTALYIAMSKSHIWGCHLWGISRQFQILLPSAPAVVTEMWGKLFHQMKLLLVVWLLNHVWLLWPRGLQPTRLLCPWDFPGENSRVGCHFLLQGIFPTQGSILCLLHAGGFFTDWAITWGYLVNFQTLWNL